MICYGSCETFTAKGGAGGPVPMNKSQIRSSFVTMIEVKKKSGGIQIGHDVNEMSVMNWISELHDCGLIRGGASSVRGVRAFTGGKSDMVKLNEALFLT
jgi:predicted nuclease with TOPRIM domain